MSRLVSRAESWEKVYSAFANINFAAFDYNTVKQSILDYIKLYFPETFNDFIESSEFIAIVESFAYIAEILAYRIDVVAHENFISTAQRRDSILNLAKLISYKVSRPLPARGLVKITSVSTTETLIDSNGNNLSGQTVRWNDVANPAWKDQFILVINRVLNQEFGNVVATDRFQLQDVLFEIYSLATTVGVLPYSTSVYGKSVSMELVPVAKSQGDAYSGVVSGITERRPQQNAHFTILYGSDGLGDSSDTTGFFCFTKQGSLQRYQTSFDGITPNQIFTIPSANINDTDVWVNNVDPDTGDIIVKQTNLPYRRETLEGKYGEWVEVDIAHAQNVIFNTNPKRNKYEIETTGNNQVRLIFGDGEFADIPLGTFEIWARTSENDDIVIPQSSIVDVPLAFTYIDTFNQAQTFTFNVTLIGSLQNASAAESIEHVRENAPAVYYTQDRMVNGEDYNIYMRQNPTILKLRAVNRTFAGDSKYITWHESSNTYENVKIFGDDGIIYIQDKDVDDVTPNVTTDVLISTYVEPLLASTDVFLQLAAAGVDHTKIRRVLNADEKTRLRNSLDPSSGTLSTVDMYYNTFTNEWYSIKTQLKESSIPALLTFGGYQNINFNGYITSESRALSYTDYTGIDVSGTINPVVGSTYVDSLCEDGGTFMSGVRQYNSSVKWKNASGQQSLGVSFYFHPQTPVTFGDLINVINHQVPTTSGITLSWAATGNMRISIAANVDDPGLSMVELTDDVDHGIFTHIIISADNTQRVECETPTNIGYAYPANFVAYPLIKVRQINQNDTRYTVTRSSRRVILESQTTSFWNVNDSTRIMDYDTLRTSFDKMLILRANLDCNRTGVLTGDWAYDVLGQEIVESGANTGMSDIHRLTIMPVDENSDKVPDHVSIEDAVRYEGLSNILKPKFYVDVLLSDPTTHTIKLPVPYIVGFNDVEVYCSTDAGNTWQLTSPPTFNITNGSSREDFGTQHAGGYDWQDPIVKFTPNTQSVVLISTALPDTHPTAITPGNIGDRYVNTTTNTVHEVAEIENITSTDVNCIESFGVGTPFTLEFLNNNITMIKGVVSVLPKPGTVVGAIGDIYINTTDDKVYTVATVEPVVVTRAIKTFSAGEPITIGVNINEADIGDRFINAEDNKIYTVLETAPVNVDATNTVVCAIQFDEGEEPAAKWAVSDVDPATILINPLDGPTAGLPGAWEYNGSAWVSFGDTPTVGMLSWYEVSADRQLLNYGAVSEHIMIDSDSLLGNVKLLIKVNECVYFNRLSLSDEWLPVEAISENMLNYVDDYLAHNYMVLTREDVVTTTDAVVRQNYIFNRLWKRHTGRDKLNFAWLHFSPRYQLVDPSPTNIIDIFVITRGYFISFKRWVEDPLATKPDSLTPLNLRNDYGRLLDNKMVSDTVILHPGKIKLLFGDKAHPALRARFKVIRSANSTLTDNQIKNNIVATTRNFFDIATFEFGETFYFTELAAAIHVDLATEISSVVLVPTQQTGQFGDMLEVRAREDEILYADIGVEDIDIVTGFTPTNLRLNG